MTDPDAVSVGLDRAQDKGLMGYPDILKKRVMLRLPSHMALAGHMPCHVGIVESIGPLGFVIDAEEPDINGVINHAMIFAPWNMYAIAFDADPEITEGPEIPEDARSAGNTYLLPAETLNSGNQSEHSIGGGGVPIRGGGPVAPDLPDEFAEIDARLMSGVQTTLERMNELNGRSAVVATMAKDHLDADDQITRILIAPLSSVDLEIRTLDVTGSVETYNEVISFRFQARPEDGRPFPFSTIVVSNEEYELLLAGDLDLPDGWGKIEDMEELYVRGGDP